MRSRPRRVSWVTVALTLGCLGALLAGCGKKQEKVATLPIYRVGVAPNTAETVQRVATAFGAPAGKGPAGLSMTAGTMLVQVDTESGILWAADRAQLWNAELRPQLPDERNARTIADALMDQIGVLPKPGPKDPIVVKPVELGHTRAARYDVATRKRTNYDLDVQVRYEVEMAIPAADSVWHLPVVGGGGDFNVTLGDGGKPIAVSGGWRPITGTETQAPLVARADADAKFRELMKGLDIQSMDASLAYQSAPSSVRQEFLYPVYEYRATAMIDGHLVPLRVVTIPATTWAPPTRKAPPARPRTDADRPMQPLPKGDSPEERASSDGGGSNKMKPRPQSSLWPWLVSDAWAQPAHWREAGTSWIGLSGGLSGSANNVQGFVDGMSADGWTIMFNWGDGAAWESDWRRNDDEWVDTADFVFYTGHASMDGWVLSSPDDGFLHFNEVGTGPASPGDMWGSTELEWAIIAACGPLQDDLISKGGGDVFDRWDGAFDRLHQLLGYGAVTNDNEDEGRLVAKYTRDGETVINAWFRAAREVQPSSNNSSAPDGPTIWVGVMYVGRSGADPANDHIWGHGSTSADPSAPTFYVAMWTTT